VLATGLPPNNIFDLFFTIALVLPIFNHTLDCVVLIVIMTPHFYAISK
jgi:hypothetical protein